MTEADIVEGLATGVLQGPQRFCGSTFVALRISGTGAAWRPAKAEYVFRDPGIWLTETMANRWLGAPVVLTHPPSGTLDTESFIDTVIGTVVKAFVRGRELWGVARVIDADAAAALAEHALDTSPAVTFDAAQIKPIMLGGDSILIERSPQMIDHLAIVGRGVWTKSSRTPAGVESAKAMETAA